MDDFNEFVCSRFLVSSFDNYKKATEGQIYDIEFTLGFANVMCNPPFVISRICESLALCECKNSFFCVVDNVEIVTLHFNDETCQLAKFKFLKYEV